MELVEVLITESELRDKVKELARAIEEYYKGETVHAICVLKGAAIFGVSLLNELNNPFDINFVSVSSYGSGIETSGVITVNLDMEEDLTGRNVLFVEDIVDSGITLDFLIKRAKERNAKDVKVCALLNKSARRRVEIDVDFMGFDIENNFVVGYGIDYDERYRDLRYIGHLRFEEL